MTERGGVIACGRDAAQGTAEIKMKMDKLVTNVYFSKIAAETELLHNSSRKMSRCRDTQEEGGVGDKCKLGRKLCKRSDKCPKHKSYDSNIE